MSSSSVQGEPMDLDLNQEPSSDSPSPTGLISEIPPWLNELETAHERIEERIRLLEAIVSRIRQPETAATTTTTATTTATPGPALAPPNQHRHSTAGVIHERSRERLVENGEKKTYLIAKALNMEKTSSVPGGYFDCNICLERAEDPVLTCCGHLFCWVCFYHLPLIYLNIKECPVCDGEVTNAEVIPIYGNGDGCDDTKRKLEDCGILLPPRPNAKRVESVRQKIINRGIPFIPMPPFEDDAFDVDSFVDTTSLRRNRRRSSRIAEIGPSPAVRASYLRNLSNNASQTISFSLGAAASSSPREFAVPGPSSAATRSQTVNPTEVFTSVTSASSSRRRTEDVNNGPRTRSRRRLSFVKNAALFDGRKLKRQVVVHSVIGHCFSFVVAAVEARYLSPAIMIYVGGVPFLNENTSSSLSSSSQESNLLLDVMSHPVIISASESFKNLEERSVSFGERDTESSTKDRYVYIFQREFAVVNPALVDFVGTDEATTCVGLVIRNRRSGMTSIAHMDSPKIVDLGISQILSLVFEDEEDAELDVHMVGGYEDVDIKNVDGGGDYAKPEGYSFPLCCKLVETLQKRRENFHLQTLFILGHNTKLDAQANTCPIFNGCLVDTSTGSIFPAIFNRTSRCPDELVRRIRVSASFDDYNWKGKLLDTYDTKTDRFIIAPCCWTMRLVEYVWELNQLPDEEILTNCSTSPSAEGPDFIDNERRIWKYLLTYPEWTKTFPRRQARVFERTINGHWKKC
ncbi:unnamed protein product, partial [Thlaspi arvense]